MRSSAANLVLIFAVAGSALAGNKVDDDCYNQGVTHAFNDAYNDVCNWAYSDIVAGNTYNPSNIPTFVQGKTAPSTPAPSPCNTGEAYLSFVNGYGPSYNDELAKVRTSVYDKCWTQRKGKTAVSSAVNSTVALPKSTPVGKVAALNATVPVSSALPKVSAAVNSTSIVLPTQVKVASSSSSSASSSSSSSKVSVSVPVSVSSVAPEVKKVVSSSAPAVPSSSSVVLPVSAKAAVAAKVEVTTSSVQKPSSSPAPAPVASVSSVAKVVSSAAANSTVAATGAVKSGFAKVARHILPQH